MLAALPVIFCPPCPPPCSGWGKPAHRPSSQPKNVSDMLPATFLSFNCWTVPMSITAHWYINARHGVKLVKETSQTSKTAKVISHATEKHHCRLAPAYWTYWSYWTPISMDRFHNLPTKRWSIIQNKMNQEVSHSSRSCCFSHKVCRQKNHSESSLVFRMSLMSQKNLRVNPPYFYICSPQSQYWNDVGPHVKNMFINPMNYSWTYIYDDIRTINHSYTIVIP